MTLLTILTFELAALHNRFLLVLFHKTQIHQSMNEGLMHWNNNHHPHGDLRYCSEPDCIHQLCGRIYFKNLQVQ